jgi:2-C-methyl-D-erythritol 4-phosphate cytidylyltransferase
MVLRAMRPFVTHPDVAQLILVLPRDQADQPPAFLSELLRPPLSGPSLSSPVVTLVSGGHHRGDSVRAGLTALSDPCSVVLIHDAARPFVDSRVIDEVVGHARRGEGAVPAVPLSDTLKESSRRDPTRVSCTRPRARLWRAQTPQGFPRSVLVEAYARAARLGRRATDDAALVEAMGIPVRLVVDSSRNLKVTTPADLELAELLAEGLV